MQKHKQTGTLRLLPDDRLPVNPRAAAGRQKQSGLDSSLPDFLK